MIKTRIAANIMNIFSALIQQRNKKVGLI